MPQCLRVQEVVLLLLLFVPSALPFIEHDVMSLNLPNSTDTASSQDALLWSQRRWLWDLSSRQPILFLAQGPSRTFSVTVLYPLSFLTRFTFHI